MILQLGQRPDRITAWDNFEVNERIKHETFVRQSKFHSVTTGQVLKGREIPSGGLLKSWYNPHAPLDWERYLLSIGPCRDSLSDDITTFFISDAIKRAFPAEFNMIFKAHPQPEIPPQDVLPIVKQDPVPLVPIHANEGTIDGTYEVQKNIFLGQYKLDQLKDFSDQIFLVYGDQKTCRLNRTTRFEQQDAELDYDRKMWLIPVAALFHLQMNFLWLIQSTHSGSASTANESASLYSNMNFLGRKNIKLQLGAFHPLERLVSQSLLRRSPHAAT